MTKGGAARARAPRSLALRESTAWKGLALVSLLVGGILVWLNPVSHPVADLSLAPLAAALLFVLVECWTDRRGAITAVLLYVLFLIGSLALFNDVPGAIATRNLNCSGSAQLVVGLGGLLLLQALVLPPWAWALAMTLASGFHPQYAFVPLLMMTILECRSILVDRRFVHVARGAALRSAALSAVAFAAFRLAGRGGINVDGVTLTLSWWIASWLMDDRPAIPPYVRALVAGTLCVSTVADFRPWPAMALILLLAYLVSGRGAHLTAGSPVVPLRDRVSAA